MSELKLQNAIAGSKSNLRSNPILSSKQNLANTSTANQLQAVDPSAPIHGSMNDLAAPPMYENTYKMKPDQKFSGGTSLMKALEKVLQNHLQEFTYDAQKVPELCKKISQIALQEVTKLGYPRYKFVAEVVIGELKGQGIKVMSRCLWDTRTDSFVSASYKNASLFATIMLFGCYYE